MVSYLPSPLDIENEAIDLDNNDESVALVSDFDKPTVALAFKLEDGQYASLPISGYTRAVSIRVIPWSTAGTAKRSRSAG